MTAESAGDGGWMTRATCRDHDPKLWFPVADSGGDVAVGHCRGCPVRVACGEHAMGRERAAPARERHGIWGGATPAQRWQVHRCRTGRCGHQPGSCEEAPWNS